MSNIYNEKVKNRYLATYENEGTQVTIRSLFAKATLTEETLNKDLYNFSIDDLTDVFKNISPKTNSIAMSAGRFIKQYITWAIRQGYRDNNDNPLNGADKKWFTKFVDRKLKIHYSYDEFLELIDEAQSYQDKILLFLLWEGISGEGFSQLRNLKYSDINYDNNTIYIKEREYHVQVDPECIKFLQKSNDEKTYIQYNMKTKEFSEKELIQSEYVLRNVRSPRVQIAQSVGINVIYNRLHGMREYLGDLEYLTPQSLRQSGMLKMAYDLSLNKNNLGYEELSQIGEKYEYSTITSEDGKFIYYNTFLMKDFVNSDNLKTLYDLDVEIQKK